MRTKENPGLAAGAKRTLRKVEVNATDADRVASLGKCPLLTSERFPGKRRALQGSCDRHAALHAIADFAHAGMFVRYVGGTYSPLTRDAIANEAWQYVRLSRAGQQVRAVECAVIVARMDELVREKYAG